MRTRLRRRAWPPRRAHLPRKWGSLPPHPLSASAHAGPQTSDSNMLVVPTTTPMPLRLPRKWRPKARALRLPSKRRPKAREKAGGKGWFPPAAAAVRASPHAHRGKTQDGASHPTTWWSPAGKASFCADIDPKFLVSSSSVSAYDGTPMDRHAYDKLTHAITKRLRHNDTLPTNRLGFAWIDDLARTVWSDVKRYGIQRKPTLAEILYCFTCEEESRYQLVMLQNSETTYSGLPRAIQGHSGLIRKRMDNALRARRGPRCPRSLHEPGLHRRHPGDCLCRHQPWREICATRRRPLCHILARAGRHTATQAP
jgi:hypothetical protein